MKRNVRVQLHWPKPTEFPLLAGDAIHVWAVPLDRGKAVQNVLSLDERRRADGFALDRPRHGFVASRAALRSLLGRYLGLPPEKVSIVTDPSGKPRLAHGDLRFNLAHSGSLALIAATRGCEIGVDAELVRPVDRAHEIAARTFHPAELAADFLRTWTRKEAVLKAVGVGVGYPLDAFQTHPQASDGDWVDLPAGGSIAAARCWLQDVRPCDDYMAAVATRDIRPPPIGFTFSL